MISTIIIQVYINVLKNLESDDSKAICFFEKLCTLNKSMQQGRLIVITKWDEAKKCGMCMWFDNKILPMVLDLHKPIFENP